MPTYFLRTGYPLPQDTLPIKKIKVEQHMKIGDWLCFYRPEFTEMALIQLFRTVSDLNQNYRAIETAYFNNLQPSFLLTEPKNSFVSLQIQTMDNHLLDVIYMADKDFNLQPGDKLIVAGNEYFLQQLQQVYFYPATTARGKTYIASVELIRPDSGFEETQDLELQMITASRMQQTTPMVEHQTPTPNFYCYSAMAADNNEPIPMFVQAPPPGTPSPRASVVVPIVTRQTALQQSKSSRRIVRLKRWVLKKIGRKKRH